jgi:DNA ligase (NAD+)
MDIFEAQERISRLTAELNRHNYLYYVKVQPEISDYEFDLMLKELERLEKEFPQLADPNSPTKRVGGDVTKKFPTAEHRFPMLSLDNTYNEEDLLDFDRRVRETLKMDEIEYVCELKIDGAAISLTYVNGKLQRAVTRGDGTKGDEITANVRTVKSVPLQLEGQGWPDLFEMRGEIFMPQDVFMKLNGQTRTDMEDKGFHEEEIAEKLMKNPRNAAAGTLKLQDSRLVAARNLDCFVYGMLGESLPFHTHFENLEQSALWGFKTNSHLKKVTGIEEVLAFIRLWDEKRNHLPYETDGIVVKVNSYSAQRSLGSTAKSPRWATAFKYKPQNACTVLHSVSYQVGRTGAVTPVANLKPVLLAGTTVKRASLHNADVMAQLDLHLGDWVFVEKGGEIIPKITGVDKEKRPPHAQKITFITHCPECGNPLTRTEGEAAFYCTNQTGCRPIILGRLIHFVGKKALDINTLGEKTLEEFFDAGFIRDAADIYTVTENQILSLEGYKELSARNILNGIEESKKIPFERVLFGLGIRYVGETVAKKLALAFLHVDNLANATEEELAGVEEIGIRIAQSVREWFGDSKNRELIQRLKEAGLQFTLDESKLKKLSNRLEGKTFVISGVFSRVSRDELKKLIEQNGGKNTSGVSKHTGYLLAGEKPGPDKVKKAEQLGVPLLSEEEFFTLIEG